MKKVLLLLLFCLSLGTMQAQQRRNIYAEFLGASNLFGISYDSRFNARTPWGYRVGLSYAFSTQSCFLFDYASTTHGFSVPAEVNYLLGSKRHFLEIGAGLSLGYYRGKATFSSEGTDISLKEEKFGYFLYGAVGYRYHARKGFTFRIGINPSFNFGDQYGIHKFSLFYPYISFGYTLPEL